MMYQILRTWASLQRSQWLKKDRLYENRNMRLRRIIDHAYHKVPFYNELYRSHGIDPVRIRSVSDLSLLPPITRRDLQSQPLETRTAIDTNLGDCMLCATSGTTGSPVRVYDDVFSVPYRDALNLRLLWAYGVRPYHKICKMRVGDPTGQKPKAFLSEAGLWGFLRENCLKQIIYDNDIAAAVTLISRWKPHVIFGMGSYLRILLESSNELKSPLDSKIIITTGETLDSLTRASLQHGFHGDVYDHYGMEEVGGSVAWECPTHSGYHINDESVLLEFLRDGEPVDSGEPGEVYITSLTHRATPIIRYATGDIATPIGEECQCGRSLSMLKDVHGRTLDALVTKDHRYVLTIVSRLQEVQGLEQFKVIQNGDFSVDVFVRIADGMETSTREELQRACTELLGDTPIRIVQVNHIDHLLGRKFRIVESKVMSAPNRLS